MKFSIEKSDEAKATQSQARIFFEKKDEAFASKNTLHKRQFFILKTKSRNFLLLKNYFIN